MLSGDSRFFEESVNASKLKALLDGRSHSHASGVKDRIQAMKWLLAMVSKGRDVSQFYPDVVKNVIVKSVELKKLVYVYLMHYTDHDTSCRELALLSINSFQKDLADTNPLIRALALRTMTSIRVRDIIQLQLMAVQKCSTDSSVYVRKTTAHALSKIHSLDQTNKEDLVQIIKKLLSDSSTMVVGSAMAAFWEICPDRYDVIHPIFRRLCNTLADLDEWGQVVAMNVLSRYARTFFMRPHLDEPSPDEVLLDSSISTSRPGLLPSSSTSRSIESSSLQSASAVRKLPTEKELESFYDEKDEDQRDQKGSNHAAELIHTDTKLQERDEKSERQLHQPKLGGDASGVEDLEVATHPYKEFKSSPGGKKPKPSPGLRNLVREDSSMDVHSEGSPMEPDHKQLLKSCLPLLRSRNSAVVLAAVNLLWACGRRSHTAMERIASAFVRLIRSSREVQYAVLVAAIPISTASPCYFRPFISHFFVNTASDASFIRFLKIDLLTLLVCKANVEQVLSEFEVYLSHPDKSFVCYVVRGIGRVVNELPEMANRCLRGLMTLMTSQNEDVVAETIVVTRTLLQQHPEHASLVRHLIRLFDRTPVPSARASMAWIACEFIHFIPEIAPDLVRKLAVSFEEEESFVKLQAANLAVRLHLLLQDPSPGSHGERFVQSIRPADLAELRVTTEKLMNYILELASFDVDYDLRDRARFLKALLTSTCYDDGREAILLSSKPPPSVHVEPKYVVDPRARFAVDSLSHCVGHAAFGYQPLLNWPAKESNASLREPESTFTASRYGEASMKSSSFNAATKKTTFYDSDDESDSDNNSEASSSSSDSDSDSKSVNSSDSVSSSSSNSSSSSSSSSSTASSDSNLSSSNVQATTTEKAPAPTHQKTQTAQTKKQPEQDDLLSLYDSYSSNGVSTLEPIPQQSSLLEQLSGDPGQQKVCWKQLLSAVHGEGLQVQRGFTRQKSSFSDTMHHIVLRITNTRENAVGGIRIRNMKLADDQQLVPFPEISVLGPHECRQVEIHVDFAGRANHPVKFSICSERGAFPVALDAPCGELIRPSVENLESFDKLVSSLSGMHMSSKQFSPDEISLLEALPLDALYQRLSSAANFAIASDSETGLVRAAACKISDPQVSVILVLGKEDLKVGCDDIVFGMSLLDEIHARLLEHTQDI